MGDSAGQLSDRLHFLRLRKLQSQRTPFRIVDKMRDKAENVRLPVFVFFGHRRNIDGGKFFLRRFQADFGVGAGQLCRHDLSHLVL